uniref:Uncharacterized protein n=1 Tax=viral metagenome TaxID=1070528 RepID=A0A6M3LW41_9ZZZZ
MSRKARLTLLKPHRQLFMCNAIGAILEGWGTVKYAQERERKLKEL